MASANSSQTPRVSPAQHGRLCSSLQPSVYSAAAGGAGGASPAPGGAVHDDCFVAWLYQYCRRPTPSGRQTGSTIAHATARRPRCTHTSTLCTIIRVHSEALTAFSGSTAENAKASRQHAAERVGRGGRRRTCRPDPGSVASAQWPTYRGGGPVADGAGAAAAKDCWKSPGSTSKVDLRAR